MSPTILRAGRYRFFFNSREESRVHVHVATPDGTAKFWLDPLVALADYHGLSPQELRQMESLVEENQDEIKSAWHQHFGR